MQQSNLVQWEEKMPMSECYSLLANLVGERSEKVLNNDEIRINYFICTSCLLEYELSEADNFIKS